MLLSLYAELFNLTLLNAQVPAKTEFYGSSNKLAGDDAEDQ
jgi:hypothetical protein